MCPNVNIKEVVDQFNELVQQLGGEPLSIEEFKSSELRGQRTGKNYAAMEAAYRIWDYTGGEITNTSQVINQYIQSKNSVQSRVDQINTRTPITTAAEHAASTRISSILSDLYPELSVEYRTSLENGNLGEIDLAALKVLVDFVNGRADTLPHEYAHYYYAMFQNSKMMKEGIKVFGSEEALVQAIGSKVVELDGKKRAWYQKFLDWIKSFFSDELHKKALLGAITDAFLERRDLGDRVYDLFGIRHQAPTNLSVDEAQLALSKMASDLMFDEANHTYSLRGSSLSLTSVSDLKTRLGYNNYDDTLEDADQKKLSNDARLRGTMIHAVLEDTFNGKFNLNRYQHISQQAAIKLYQIATKLLEQYDFVASEAMMYDEQIQAAGTTDLILRDKKTGEFVVLDYKTKLVKYNGKDEKPNGKRFWGFSYATSKNRGLKSSADAYNFQTMLYQKMLQKAGLNVTKRGIIPLVYEVEENNGDWSITDIDTSKIFGSEIDETGEWSGKSLNDKKLGVQWMSKDQVVSRDVNAKLYEDYSDFATPEAGKRFVSAMDDAFAIITKIRNKLNAQIDIATRRDRKSAAYRSRVALAKVDSTSDLDAMLVYLLHTQDQLNRMVEVLQDLSKQGENANWSLAKLAQYYQIAQSVDILNDISGFLAGNEDLLSKTEVASLTKAVRQLQTSVSIIKGYYDNQGKKLYLSVISKGTNAYRNRLIERQSRKYTEEHPMEDGESNKAFEARRKAYIDDWVKKNEAYLDKEQAKWLDAQTKIADNSFEANILGQYFASVYESTDPFVSSMVRLYDSRMEEVNHKRIAMMAKLNRLVKQYYADYNFNSMSDLRKEYDDFVDVTKDGKCYLVSSVSAEFLSARDQFEYDLKGKTTLTAEERRKARREWYDQNCPISDLEAYISDFEHQLNSYLAEQIESEKEREKLSKAVSTNFNKGSLKISWQKFAFDKKGPIASSNKISIYELCDFLLELQRTLDSKYRKPSAQYKNEKYDKMMQLDKNDSKRKLWETFLEISNDEYAQYSLPLPLQLRGRLPSVVKGKFEEAVTNSVGSAVQLGIKDTFCMLDDDYELIHGEFYDENGNKVYQIPMPFTGKRITEDKQSFNLPDIFLRYYEAANEYKVKKDLEEYVKYTQSILASRRTYTDKNANYNDSEAGTKFSEHTRNLFDSWVQQVFYNERISGRGAINIGKYKIEKALALKAIAKYSSVKVMAGNLVSAVNNILTGDAHGWEEAFAGKYISIRSYAKAHKIFMAHIPALFADAFRTVPEDKVNKLCQWFHIFDGSEGVTYRGLMSNSAGDYAYALTSLGERWIQGKFVIAYFLEMRAKDKDGNDLGSMWDFIDFDENNQLIVTDDRVANFNASTQAEVSLMLRKVSMGLNGNYDGKRAAVSVESNALGWFGLALRRWIEPFVARRIGRETYDDTLGTVNNGMYRTFGRYLWNDARLQLLDSMPETVKQFFHIQSKQVDGIKRSFRKWGELQDWEKANVKRTAVELGLATLALLIFMGLGGSGGDDDDQNNAIKFFKYQAYRLYTDLTFIANPVSFSSIFRDPFPAQKLVTDVSSVFNQLFDPTETYQSGNHMFDNKLLNKTVKMLPGSNQLYRLKNIQNEINYFVRGK